MPLNKSWHDYNESLIERGHVLIDIAFLKSPNKEIKKMNNGKVGVAPFQYSDSYVQFLVFLKIGFKIPYRMVQGIVRELSEYVKIVKEIHFTHIRRRMTRIKPSIGNDNDKVAIRQILIDSHLYCQFGQFLSVIPLHNLSIFHLTLLVQPAAMD